MSLTLAQLLSSHRDEIVSRFLAKVEQQNLSPPGVPRSLLRDHIPVFLDEIVGELAQKEGVRFSQDANDESATARRHGGQRWSLGYDLEAVLREYGVLRHAIVESAKASGVDLTVDEFDLLTKCLNVGVAEAASEYVRYRDQQLDTQRANLEFLAEAGRLLSSSLDYRSTISQLTRLVVPQLADWCAIHIDGVANGDIPIAHVDQAKVDALRAVYREFPAEGDSPYAYARVIETGEPRLVFDVDPRIQDAPSGAADHVALVRALQTHSWLIVPLRIGKNTFGALTLAFSDSSRRYAPADLVLAGDLARRAAIAIDNAKLYELSQNERTRVETATRAKDEFVATVSHELRTPLNAILGWVRLMKSEGFPDSKRDHAVDVIGRNADALNQLVSDLLDISRAFTGKLAINPSRVDLASVIDIAVEDARPALDAKRIRVVLDLDRERTTLRADAERVHQIVWNLLNNAVKFTPKDGEIRVDLRRVASDVELTIRDTGIGISAEFLAHVFETFRQADSSAARSHGGLGIGLSITKHLVELHGGAIEARSDGPGKGATFIVRLPVSAVMSALTTSSTVAAADDASSAAPDVRLEGIHALVVDDDADARDMISFLLRRSGIETHAVDSAAHALEELEHLTPDVIISDIGMPAEDGYSLVRRIRTLASDEKKNIPAIALTAFAGNEDRTRALVAGFNQHLVKPVKGGVLLKAVADLVGPVPRHRKSD